MNAAKKDQVLCHYGVKGMHWGVRRYQNYDGTLIGSRPKTSREKIQDYKIKKLKKGDPTSEAMSRVMKKSNSKLAKKMVENYETRKEGNIKKAEAKKEQISQEADKKFAKKVAEKNPIYYKSKTLSNEELKKQIDRLNLEESYRKAATRDIYNAENFVKYNKKYEEKNFMEKFSDETERNLRQELGRQFTQEILKQMAMTAI